MSREEEAFGAEPNGAEEEDEPALNDVYTNMINDLLNVTPVRPAQGRGFGNVPNRPRMPPPVPMPVPQPVLLANSVGSFYMGQPTQPTPVMKENIRTLMALVDAAGEGMKNGEVLSEGCWLEMCDVLQILYAQVDT